MLSRGVGVVSAPPSFELVSAGASDIGSVRRLNEDAWIARPEIGLWAVADGMGGHHAGDVASQLIVDLLAAIPPPSDAGRLFAHVRDAIEQANSTLRSEANKREAGTVIGATVVVLMASDYHFACLWAGDSRLYRFRDGTLTQLSRDHSQVQDMVEAGIIEPDDAERHPLANVITRAVGAHDDIELDMITDEIADGDIFLACTDGLTKMVSDAEISEILANAEVTDQPAALIAAALANGGKDNVTAVVVQVCGR